MTTHVACMVAPPPRVLVAEPPTFLIAAVVTPASPASSPFGVDRWPQRPPPPSAPKPPLACPVRHLASSACACPGVYKCPAIFIFWGARTFAGTPNFEV